MNRIPVALAVLALSGSLTLVACSDEEPGGTEPRGIDARHYFDDYESGEGDSAMGSAPYAASADEGGSAELPEIPGPLEENTFVDAGTSGFTDTAADPQSTFALDVDTGSFSVARALLAQGLLPPADSIRVEEWVNAMDYADPAPTQADQGEDLGITAESSIAPSLSDGTQVVRVAVAAREVTPQERPRVNVTLVVDRSGSMDLRERLGLVQSSLALLADRLSGDDTVSVVSFEDQARPILQPTPVRRTDKILDAVEALEPGGSTNLEAGLRLGYEQARASYDDEAVNLVVLCSDGVANVGRTGPGSITEQIAEEGADGIHLVTVGYGMGNYNDHLMEQLANLGDGFYSYVDTFEEAERLFGTELATTLTPVAAEARTQVEFDPALVSSYRLIGYDNRAIADDHFEDMAVDAGELGAGHRATALYEVRLAEGVGADTAIGSATLRWRSVDGDSTREVVTDIFTAGPEATPSRDLALAATVADLAQLLKAAEPIAGRGLDLAVLERRARAVEADELTTLIEQARAAG